MCELLAFTSVKGSSGKTAVAANTAMALAHLGHTVTLLEVHRSASRVLGAGRCCTLRDFVSGYCSEGELAIPVAENVTVVTTGEPPVSAETGAIRVQGIAKALESRDYVIIDAPEGVADSLEPVMQCASDVFAVVTPEQIANTEAISFVQDLNRISHGKQINLILNNAPFAEMAEIICNRIEHDFTQILGIPVICIAFIGEKSALGEDPTANTSIMFPPASEAWSGIRQLASTIQDAHRQPCGAVDIVGLLTKLMSAVPREKKMLLTGPEDVCPQMYAEASQDEVDLFREIILEAFESYHRDSLDFRNLYEMVRQLVEFSRSEKDCATYFPVSRL
ncbi:MAG TPA: hypothetical protein VK463_05315 [Desulfomonilaceae bacterium]|nr:hypothetical protein [Desulfomonilaceae bacterium]